MKLRMLIASSVLTMNVFAQFEWTWEELPVMPEAISNNAVTSATVDDQMYVFSFSGIDSSKTNEGISLNSMRYSVSNGEWEYIASLPDTLGKIAAGASTIDNMIYIIGGYHVFDGPPFELSSDRVHRYDPESNTYLPDGAPLPYAIDDHVQAVWRDSLIYVITGWSDNQNVEYVQIYDPYLDTWQLGNSVPSGIQYEAFGASGTIIGDTIYYFGGAVGFSFNSTGRLRKGVINPEDPTDIEWSVVGFSPNERGYRCAALNIDQRAYWIGGSHVTYNYDGIAYNGSGGVSPLNRILGYDPLTDQWHDMNWQPYGIMDLRGIAQISDHEFVIAGGMESGQQVTDRVFLLTYSGASSLDERLKDRIDLYPNPLIEGQELTIANPSEAPLEISIYDVRGAFLQRLRLDPGKNRLSPDKLKLAFSGTYYFLTESGHRVELVFTRLPR